MISSTAKDLPEHRKQLLEACLRADTVPLLMETLPADPADAVAVSLRMVDEADVYLGVFAYRYGYVPPGHEVSITELEYLRAVERKIPCLIFFMHEDHPVRPRDVETGSPGERLARLKDRIGTAHVAAFFRSPEDLRAHAIHSLEALWKRLRAAAGGAPEPIRFHPVSLVPRPPEPYVAHSYTLLQTGTLIGRQGELTTLTDWVSGQGELARAAVLAVVALGGMGKSALTWHWFQTAAEQEWPAGLRGPLQGRLWWSFYESDAHFENFLPRALAYVLGRSEAAVRQEVPSLHEQGEVLLRELDRRPFLLVLDGLERLLTAYSGASAAHRCDDDRLDAETGNRLGEKAGRHPLRRAADPRAGLFLRRLAGLRASRVLLSSRLFPADLQTSAGAALPGGAALFLAGLGDGDAVELWRAFGARGSREQLLPVFDTFGRHPLLIQVLAGEVADLRSAPGDFDAWRQANPDFHALDLPLVQVRSHMLEHALRGLTEAQRKVLHAIAGFRMAVGIATLRALFVGSAPPAQDESAREPWRPLFGTFAELDAALTVLEDRGLLGWDRRANRYDLHPIVRGVVWAGLDEGARRGVRRAQHDHFAAVPTPEWLTIASVDDLTPAIELFHALVDLGQYDEAQEVFRDRLSLATLYRLSAGRLEVSMMERLFPDGIDRQPRLARARARAYTLDVLSRGYKGCGRPGASADLLARSEAICRERRDDRNLSAVLYNRSGSERLAGRLRNADAAVREAIHLSRVLGERSDEAIKLNQLARVFESRGATASGLVVSSRSLRLLGEEGMDQAEGVVRSYRAELLLRVGDPAEARRHLERAEELAGVSRHALDVILVNRLWGACAVLCSDFSGAERRLSAALSRCRDCDMKEEELPTLVALAELRRRQGRTDEARDLLEQVWEPAELGPFPAFHAEALNLLAGIECDAGNRDAAAVAAAAAFRKAWCDGPPYGYHWGLLDAREHLAGLGAPEPEMPPFDPSRHPPLADIGIDLPGESSSTIDALEG
jgi:tetratricopeptide (TPR) repeat protein